MAEPGKASRNWQALSSVGLILVLALGTLAIQQQLGINLFSVAGFQQAADWAGIWGPVLYIILLIISVVVSQIPGAPLAIAAGAVWGPFHAGLYSILGGFLGSLIAYSLGRTIGQPVLQFLTGKTLNFSKARGELYLGGLIFLMRLFPAFSFDLISYGAGIAGLSLPVYAGATLFGMIPSTFLLTYLGGSFHWGTGALVAMSSVLIAALVLLPWGIKKHDWFGLRDVVEVS